MKAALPLKRPTMHTSNRLTPVQWLICVIAAIGFAFDTYELLMFPLINRPALTQLGGLEFGTPEYRRWLGLMFYVPAVCGGIFGLLGGYLTDRLGRRRVLDVEHLHLRVLGVRGRVYHQPAVAAAAPLHDVHRCLC